MKKTLALLVGIPALTVVVPMAIVQGVISLRSNYQTSCKADAWMTEDFRRWADELRHAA